MIKAKKAELFGDGEESPAAEEETPKEGGDFIGALKSAEDLSSKFEKLQKKSKKNKK